MRARFGRPHLLASLAALVVLIVGGAAIVNAHGGDAAKVHSCVNKYAGWIRIVPADGTCTIIENALDWGQAGATGPTGPSGATGPTGPAGAVLNGVREYTSSGSFTVPAGVTRILVEAIGGGGGGATRHTAYGGGGGGGGGYVRAVMTVTPGAVCTVTVGSGGGFATDDLDAPNGDPGTASAVDCGGGALITAGGGAGGNTGAAAAGGGGTLPPAPSGQGLVRTGGAGTALIFNSAGVGGIATRGSLRVAAGDGGDGSPNDPYNAFGESGLPGWVLIQW